jgi:Rieske Fe-S protein
MPMEFSPQQMSTLERLMGAGFSPIAIPPYESALCMRKGECAVVLAPVPNGGLKVLAPASYLVEGNFGVKLKRGSGEVFVWKKAEIPATQERLRELDEFRRELMEILEMPQTQ